MAILGNYKNIYDTETTAANKSMGFDPSAIQSCLLIYLWQLHRILVYGSATNHL